MFLSSSNSSNRSSSSSFSSFLQSFWSCCFAFFYFNRQFNSFIYSFCNPPKWEKGEGEGEEKKSNLRDWLLKWLLQLELLVFLSLYLLMREPMPRYCCFCFCSYS